MTDELMMMPISLECIGFLGCCAAGAVLALILSLIFAVEKAFSFTEALSAIFDFLFCLLCFEMTFRLLMRYCSGRIRGYFLLGIMLGALIFCCSVGEYAADAFSMLLILLKRGACGLFRLISVPIFSLLRAMRKAVKKIFEVFYEIAKKVLRNRKFCLKKRAE